MRHRHDDSCVELRHTHSVPDASTLYPLPTSSRASLHSTHSTIYYIHHYYLNTNNNNTSLTMPGQHDTTPIQTVIYKPNEHADEYIVAIDDVAEVSPCSTLLSLCLLFISTLIMPL